MQRSLLRAAASGGHRLSSRHLPVSSTQTLLNSPKSFQRNVTNASKPDYVSEMLQVPRVDSKPGGWQPTLIHSSGEVKFTVIRIPPGGEVPSHYHHESWDYFVPLQGQGVIESKTKSGDVKDYPMEIHSFLAMPPEDNHRVCNRSDTNEFVFLIAQAPRNKYDFVDAQQPHAKNDTDVR